MKTNNKLVRNIYLAFVFAMSALAVNAAQYIDGTKPLGQIVSTQVGAVKTGGPVQVPVITWGGDIATLYANGGDVNTQPGSIFASQKGSFKLVRKDVFSEQLQDYINGTSMYLRGTAGMLNQALSALKDPRVRPVVIYQLTWSTGGDVLVVRPSVKDAADLKGKTIVVQAYGPHVDFLVQTLKDAGVDISQVTIKYVKDITGTDNSPSAAFKSDPSIDAAFVISPDAVALTGGPGKVGTGKETVNGARYLMSTATANRVIADVYAVRSDYLNDHTAEVEAFVNGLLNAEEQLLDLSKNAGRKSEYDKFMAQAGLVFLDSKDGINDAKGLLGDCTFVGYQGNIKFFTDPSYPRRFERVSSENQDSLIALGLLTSKSAVSVAGFDYEKIKSGLRHTAVEVESSHFDPAAVAALVAKKGDALESVFTFEVAFEPKLDQFDIAQYKEQFDKVISLASTYRGAVLTVEGHVDPTKYLESLRAGNQIEAKQRKQSGINLSVNRANSVRDELLNYAKSQKVGIDESQITTIGHGGMKPKRGVEKDGPFKGEPLPPLTEKEWRANMRVVFRIANVEAESDVFVPVK